MAGSLNQDQLMDERAAAILVGVKVETLQRWRWAKKGLPFLKIGRCVRYRHSDIVAFLDQCRVKVDAP